MWDAVRERVQHGGGGCISEKFGGKLQLCSGAGVSLACVLSPIKCPGNGNS